MLIRGGYPAPKTEGERRQEYPAGEGEIGTPIPVLTAGQEEAQEAEEAEVKTDRR